MKICSIEGCESTHMGKGYCKKHYMLYWRNEKGELYRTWEGIKKRCLQKNSKSFKNYGALGIKICNDWINNFEQFAIDMGEKPTPQHSIDRINNDLGYSKENCRWANKWQQAWNHKTNNKDVGVCFDKSRNKWKASLKIDKKTVFQSRFKDYEQALEARKKILLQYGITN